MKKLLFKLSILAVLVFVFQALVGTSGINFETFDSLKSQLDNRIDTLFMGDCVNFANPRNEKDTRTIVTILRENAPHRRIGYITHNAYHLDLYYYFCRYIVKQANHPRTIIIEINMRSFSPVWDMMPQYQFEKEKIILQGGIKSFLFAAFYKPLRIIGYDFTTVTRERFLETPVYMGTREVGKIKDLNKREGKLNSEANIRKKTLLFYMYSLSEGHRKIKSMVNIARILKKNGIQIIFYITPIDSRGCERYYPGQFEKQLKENTALIKRLLSEEGVSVLDLSTDLGSEYFNGREYIYPNERLDITGRVYIAQRISERLK